MYSTDYKFRSAVIQVLLFVSIAIKWLGYPVPLSQSSSNSGDMTGNEEQRDATKVKHHWYMRLEMCEGKLKSVRSSRAFY